MKNETLQNVGIASIIAGFIGLLVLSPILTFGFAYIGGMIIKFFAGNLAANGLNILFGTTRFSANDIPVICAILATIGKYFKSSQTNNKE